MPLQLDEKIYSKITELCKEGDDLVEKENYSEALQKFNDAYFLIPEPIHYWEASTWILTALGETYFFIGKFDEARRYLSEAMHCPNGIGNPLIHLRLGQALYEIGEETKAKDELCRAYMAEGKDIFDGENPKYFNFLKKHIKVDDK